MRELSVAEQRYLAVLAVIGEGHPVSSVAQQWGVSRQTVHAWLGRYETGGLAGLADRSHRPSSCPHQMPAGGGAAGLGLGGGHRGGGARGGGGGGGRGGGGGPARAGGGGWGGEGAGGGGGRGP